MPWIEGIGDEVTVFFCVVSLLCIVLAAWFSTGIREIPFISVIIVQLTRRRRRNQQQNQSGVGDQPGTSSEDSPDVLPGTQNESVSQQAQGNENSSDHVEAEQQRIEIAGSSDEHQIETVVSSDQDASLNWESHAASTGQTEQNLETSDRPDGSSSAADFDIPENLTNEELRQRRLDFLNGKVETCDTDNQERKGVIKEEDSNRSGSTAESQPERVSLGREHSSQVNEAETALPASSDIGSQRPGATKQSASVVNSESQSGESGAIKIKIKFLNDTHRHVDTNLNETIGSFRRRHFSTEISESKLVRFIYNGQDLRNDASTLQSYNIGNNSVLHCLITQPRQEAHPNTGNNDDSGLDIGVLMFPLFGLLLSIVWYLRFMYRQLFNVTSTLTLGGITFLYLAALLSSFRAQRPHEHLD